MALSFNGLKGPNRWSTHKVSFLIYCDLYMIYDQNSLFTITHLIIEIFEFCFQFWNPWAKAHRLEAVKIGYFCV